jgi:hypothetical protein
VNKFLVAFLLIFSLGCTAEEGQGLPGGNFVPHPYTFEEPLYWECRSDFYQEFAFYMTFPDMPREIAIYIAGEHFWLCTGKKA